MDLKIIKYDSPEYKEMIALRHKILREPLGLNFTEKDFERDRNDILLGVYFPNSKQMVGCCILSPLNDHTVQLRQMAIDSHQQGKGTGSEMLQQAEKVASERNFGYVYMHAREVAVAFYKKHGYTIESDKFIEVGIPHFEMLKQLKQIYNG